MLFFNLGIDNKTTDDTTYASLKDDCGALYNESLKILQEINDAGDKVDDTMFYRVESFLKDADNQVIEVERAITRLKYIGSVYKGLTSHYKEEQEYFGKLLRDELDDDYIVRSFSDWNVDHATLISRLVDLDKKSLEFELTDITIEGANIEDTDFYEHLRLSRLLWDRLGTVFGGLIGKDAGPIHPLLLAHVIREGKRGEFIMSNY